MLGILIVVLYIGSFYLLDYFLKYSDMALKNDLFTKCALPFLLSLVASLILMLIVGVGLKIDSLL